MPFAARTRSAKLTPGVPITHTVEAPPGAIMRETGISVERLVVRDFFAREYLLDDIRWMVARLLGRSGGSGEIGAVHTPVA